jgi:2,3-bisphosphoglycerate-independent phosphoglycerate mutase
MGKSCPVALIIIDGWGIGPDDEGNAVSRAATPYLNSLLRNHSHASLTCFGEAVGLPKGQMGNSEVGHLNLGAGRVVWQDITRINKAIRENQLGANPTIARAIARVLKTGSTLHLMGLVSDGGVHSLQTHFYALIKAATAAGVGRIAIHAFLDGRDTPPDSGTGYLQQLQNFLKDYPMAKVATVTGRYWAMDRDKRWDRISLAWAALVRGEGPKVADPVAAVMEAYARQEYDEFVKPVIIATASVPVAKVADSDTVIFLNFRADRARALTWAFTETGFTGFDVSDRPALTDYVCMTQYDEHLKDVAVAFPPHELTNMLAEVVSQAGARQLHIAETEKYAHVTFFFNGGREKPFPGEERVLVPSPKEVATYDQKPAMSAREVTAEVIKHIESGAYDLIVMNYANCDMVGHTGVFAAAKAAVETLDECLSRVIPAVVSRGGAVLLTSDHGNAEQMIDHEHGGPYTAHTAKNPVPVILIDPSRPGAKLRDGALCDVAPTVLAMMGLPAPAEMTGVTLF